MISKLAACEPCRHSKLACDRSRPVCSRCLGSGRVHACTYRPRPFQRRTRPTTRINRSRPLLPSASNSTLSPVDHSDGTPDQQAPTAGPREEVELDATPVSLFSHRYPNPGYLGPYSNPMMFDQVISLSSSNPDAVSSPRHGAALDLMKNQDISDRAIHCLTRLERLNFSSLHTLVLSWLGKGVNLSLAEPFVALSSNEALAFSQRLRSNPSTSFDSDGVSRRAGLLSQNTQTSITVNRNSTPADYVAQMVGDNIRWETLGFFLAAAARAALDTPTFGPLYTCDQKRQSLIKGLTYIGDCCLEICLALDCLNDLQLILQYESFVVHSQADGDQSYHSWRKIGDIASSLFALGYHEKIDETASNIPVFLAELRRSCFARIYAADKSLAIFLGRPPRVIKEYCYFHLPANTPNLWLGTGLSVSSNTRLAQGAMNSNQINIKAEPICYTADTRCGALFAALKEEILQRLRSGLYSNPDNKRNLESRVEAQWQQLPSHFRLNTSLTESKESPFGRDFLAAIKLDYLHTLFMLNLAGQRTLTEVETSTVHVSMNMLSLVLETIILRDSMVNSGTCLIWKVAQYGLPTAGSLCLFLLRSRRTFNRSPDSNPPPRSQIIQNLSVLVAEIEIGSWIQIGDPNFALFTQVTRTIQGLLDSLLDSTHIPEISPVEQDESLDPDSRGLFPEFDLHSWDFEMDFWTHLAAQPIGEN